MSTDLDLDALKVGDEVAYEVSSYSNTLISTSWIERFTKTQIITTEGYRWHRNSGRRVGWDRSGSIPTPFLLNPNSPRVVGILARERVLVLKRAIAEVGVERNLNSALDALEKIEVLCQQLRTSLDNLSKRLDIKERNDEDQH